MQTTTGKRQEQWTIQRVLEEKPGNSIELRGCIHHIRDMAEFAGMTARFSACLMLRAWTLLRRN